MTRAELERGTSQRSVGAMIQVQQSRSSVAKRHVLHRPLDALTPRAVFENVAAVGKPIRPT